MTTTDRSELRVLAELNRVVGLAERDLGNLDAARQALQLSADQARAFGDSALAASAESRLAYVTARLGDLDTSLELLRDAAPHLSGVELARSRNDLGAVLYWRGELEEAALVIEMACDELARHDSLSEAKARGTLGAVLSQLARYGDAQRHLELAVAAADAASDPVISASVRENLGYLAMLQGDLPAALEQFELAERGLAAAGAATYLPRLHADHAQALAEAALFGDAEELLNSALQMFEAQGNDIEVAGGLVTAAEIRLAQGDVAGAREAANDAAQWYRKQNRDRWVVVASNLALQAAARSEDHEPDLVVSLDEAANLLERNGLTAEAIRSRLVAARLRAESSDSGHDDVVSPVLRRAAGLARTADRMLLAYIDALMFQRRDDRRAARRAITRGLKLAMSAQAALGSIETRAHAAVHGHALTQLGARFAIADGRPRELLLRIETTRLMTSRMPALRPPEDSEMAAMLTELRSLNGQIADPSTDDNERRDAEHSRMRVERDVRRRSRTTRGDTDATFAVRDELGSALAMLGDRQLLAHAALDGQLYAVSVVGRRAKLHELGPIAGVSEQVEAIAFSLNRLNRLQGSEASRVAAAEMLYSLADELTELLLPPVIVDSMNAVIIVPTAVLHDVPWGLLPPLGGRAVSINPSVSAWARANRTRQERKDSRSGLRAVGFMAGPGLEFAELEVEHLAAEYIDPAVFTGPDATGAACVELLGRADLVHIACHGSFRTDNPMFSSLHLADGPLIVHDLERLDRLPETVVLPACSVANAKALQGGSLLGLATALITLGAANVIAPLTPINDASSVTVMQRLHRELVAGTPPAASLAAATMSHDLADPTAAAFIALGA